MILSLFCHDKIFFWQFSVKHLTTVLIRGRNIFAEGVTDWHPGNMGYYFGNQTVLVLDALNLGFVSQTMNKRFRPCR